MRKINYIVLHCTAGPQDQSILAIQQYWKIYRGWKQPGYHHIIKADGTIVDLLPIEKVSNGVAGHNHDSIHISYLGGVDKKNKPIDNRTEAQKKSQIQLLRNYKAMFPNAKILGHCDFKGVNKACPSFNVAQWLKTITL